MVELDVPAMIHVSQACNPAFHTTGSHYLNGDTAAFMQCMTSDLFKNFPTLKFIIPHGGGAVPYHWGRFRGIAQDMKLPPLTEHVLRNVFFDTCVYHMPGQELLAKVIPAENILFASEMIGAVRGIDPETGHHYDDTKRYVEQLTLSAADKAKLYEGNARNGVRQVVGTDREAVRRGVMRLHRQCDPLLPGARPSVIARPAGRKQSRSHGRFAGSEWAGWERNPDRDCFGPAGLTKNHRLPACRASSRHGRA